MRITNRMMTNNMLSNINTNKNQLSALEQQYSTGKKIQKPSEDPIVAVRALKLRTNLAELNQYYEKNIPDAKSWMEVTESALKTVNDVLTQMNSYCVQGANDTLTKSDRNSIASNLQELKDQIYQEGNSNYAGRYVFTGYKTDTSLVFAENTSDLHYRMTEKLDYTDIQMTPRMFNETKMEQYDKDNPESSELADKPYQKDVYRVRLSYDNLVEDAEITINLDPERNEKGELVYDEDGAMVYSDSFDNIVTVSAYDEKAYLPEDGTIHFIPETGELIMAADVYTEWSNSERVFHISYEKREFEKNDLRPEHYFDCTSTVVNAEGELEPDSTIKYTKKDQKIQYEVNFNQKLDINVQGSDALTHEIGRCIDDILAQIDSISQTEDRIEQTEKLLADEKITDEQKKALNEMLSMLETERTIKEETLRASFAAGITDTQEQQDLVGEAIADIGSRYVRLELTESRLSIQQVDFTELLSQNEDADLVDTIINFMSQETIYNAALNAAGQIVQNSLLDFL